MTHEECLLKCKNGVRVVAKLDLRMTIVSTAQFSSNFCRATLCIARAMLWRGVCLSVTFVYYIKTAKHILKLFHLYKPHHCRAMRCISAAYVGMRCLSVRSSRSWIVPKRIKISSKCFSPSGSHAILVFLCQTGWRYSDGNCPNGSVECRWGRQNNAILDEYLASLHTGLQCYQPYEWRSVKNKLCRS